jgi:hypothetical protein
MECYWVLGPRLDWFGTGETTAGRSSLDGLSEDARRPLELGRVHELHRHEA